MIMDELSELNRRIATLEGELDSLKAEGNGAAQAQYNSEVAMIHTLSELAGRLEGITAKLNARPAQNPAN